MAVYEAPVRHEDHYIERSETNAGFWAVVIVLGLLLLLLLFGSNIFGRGGTGNNNTGGTNLEGTVNTPSGSGSGSVNVQ